MTTTQSNATRAACRVLRCIAPAVWHLTVKDEGQHATSGDYCGQHAGQNVAALPRAGRRVTLDALALVEAVAR